MFRNRFILKSVAALVNEAASRTLADLREGWIEQEPQFTERLITNLQERIDGKTIKGIRWKAKTLTDRSPQAQESVFGADFLGVLTLDLQGLSVTKGFFAQAKLIRRRSKYASAKEFDLLKKQCGKMLSVTPDAFVFLYSKRSIKIVPACSVVGTSGAHMKDLANRSIARFFVEYVECFIGDPKLEAPTLEKFYALAQEYEIRKGLYLHASDEGDLTEKEPQVLTQEVYTQRVQQQQVRIRPLLA